MSSMTRRHKLLLEVLYNLPTALVDIIHLYGVVTTLKYVDTLNITKDGLVIRGHNDKNLYLYDWKNEQLLEYNILNKNFRVLKLNLELHYDIKIIFTKNNTSCVLNNSIPYLCSNFDINNINYFSEIKVEQKFYALCCYKNIIYMSYFNSTLYELNIKTNNIIQLHKMENTINQIVGYNDIIYCLGHNASGHNCIQPCTTSKGVSELLPKFNMTCSGVYDFFICQSKFYLIKTQEVLVHNMTWPYSYEKEIKMNELDILHTKIIKMKNDIFVYCIYDHIKPPLPIIHYELS